MFPGSPGPPALPSGGSLRFWGFVPLDQVRDSRPISMIPLRAGVNAGRVLASLYPQSRAQCSGISGFPAGARLPLVPVLFRSRTSWRGEKIRRPLSPIRAARPRSGRGTGSQDARHALVADPMAFRLHGLGDGPQRLPLPPERPL